MRPWTCAWPPPLQRQLAGMLHRRHSIASWRTTGMKSENFDNRTLLRMGGRIQPSLERFRTRRTSPPVSTGSSCRRNPFIAGGNTKSKSLSCARGQPWLAHFSRILQRGQGGSSQGSSTEPLYQWGHVPALDGATTTSATPRLTQQYLTTTMTLSPL